MDIFRLIFQPGGGAYDNYAMSGLLLHCKANDEWQSSLFPNKTGDAEKPAQFCPGSEVICSIQQRIEAHIGSGDDTALNGVEFQCCDSGKPTWNICRVLTELFKFQSQKNDILPGVKWSLRH